jgi:hypothetical protein
LFLHSDLASTILSGAKAEISKCSDVKKLLASCDLFCGFLNCDAVTRTSASAQLMLLLGHKFPRLRTATAERLFVLCELVFLRSQTPCIFCRYVELLSAAEAVPAEHASAAVALLMDTPWDAPLEQCRPARNVLCGFFGVPVPKMVVSKTTATASTSSAAAAAAPADELQSYQDLVDRAGY